jgi:acetolactate synthase I/II/III large subunit
MNAADFVISSLENQGIKDVFLLPGGGCMYLVDSLARSEKIQSWPLLHEQSVGIAAEAYSQYSDSLGVALVTTGPGGTNALTACAAAWLDSTPVLFISGQVKTSDNAKIYGVRQLGFQEIPITEMARSITKGAIRIQKVDELPTALAELILLAQSDRPGPVWLDIPLDIQASKVELAPLQKITPERSSSKLSEQLMDKILSDWSSAKRPILLLGNGVRLSGGLSVSKSLVNETNTPCLLTWKALDFLPEAHELNAGRPGAIAQRWSNFAQQTADFILVIGARLDLGQTAYRPENFAPNAVKYIVDIDETELKKLECVGATCVQSDAMQFMQLLLKKIVSQNLKLGNSTWNQKITEWKNRYPLLQEKHIRPTSGVNLYQFISKLSEVMLCSDLLVPGSSGACSEIAMQGFQVKPGQRVLNSEGLGPMGFGIPAPIGACIASGFKRTVSIDGDGGFLMNIQDLATIEMHNLPIKIFVLNNDGYGSIKTSQDRYFEGRRLGTDRSTGLAIPEIEPIVKGFKLQYEQISNVHELDLVMDRVFIDNTPIIIEVSVDPMQETEPRTFTTILPDGKMQTASMENLHPLLSEEILSDELDV